MVMHECTCKSVALFPITYPHNREGKSPQKAEFSFAEVKGNFKCKLRSPKSRRYLLVFRLLAVRLLSFGWDRVGRIIIGVWEKVCSIA